MLETFFSRSHPLFISFTSFSYSVYSEAPLENELEEMNWSKISILKFPFFRLRFNFCVSCLKSLHPPLQLSVLKVPNAESEETDKKPHQQDQIERKLNKRPETYPMAAQAGFDSTVIAVQKHFY